MKRCPFCAEEIQDAAVVCRYCGRDLVPAAPALAQATPPTPKKGWGAGRWILLIGSGGLALLLFYTWATSSYSVDREGAEEVVRLLERDLVLTGFEFCSTNRPNFRRPDWLALNERQRRNLMLALSRMCIDRKRPREITLVDPASKRVLASFNGWEVTDLSGR